MGFAGGAALRLLQTLLYALCFCCSGIILGIYSYFLAVQADRNVDIPTWHKAVEGMSGVGVLYTIFAVVLTCCLGGITFFAFLGIVLDFLLAGAFIAIAVLTRDGTHSCSGLDVKSPLGNGIDDSGKGGFDSDNVTYSVSYGTACRMNKACFAVSIVGAGLFVIAAFVQLGLGRSHKREKRFGPSPANNYTSGSGRRFWQRKPKTTYTKDAEAGVISSGGIAATNGVDNRVSYDTAYTGSTVGGTHNTYTGSKYDPHGPGMAGHAAIPETNGSHGFHTSPTGTAVNPYGYDSNHRTAATNY